MSREDDKPRGGLLGQPKKGSAGAVSAAMFADGPKPTHGSRAGRPIHVKNRAPAPVQITAEQILREASERQEGDIKPPETKITDPDELEAYRLRKRKEFEDTIRRTRQNIGAWINYAQWEASQQDFTRARSVWERALDVDYRNQTLWQKYAEMEMLNKFVNHARNVYDRAVSLLPRIDQFWYKYAHMEEMLGNVDAARQVFERWMQWKPDPNAWSSYIMLELRHKNYDLARGIYERYLLVHPEVATYLKYAKFEENGHRFDKARVVYEQCLETLGEAAFEPALFLKFGAFEERMKEVERARTIYKYGLEKVPKHLAEELYKRYTAFEKQHGDKSDVENVVLSKRRQQYADDTNAAPHNYDLWFDWIRLEESQGHETNSEHIRDVYEQAIAKLPPVQEKLAWKRYIYLWINYALYEELEAKAVDRTRAVYKECLTLIPHHLFTFSKIWLMYAEFEIRQKNLDGARKILGQAIGRCQKEKIFKGYIELELQLANIDRCRKLYEKYLEFAPENCYAWSKYAELERSLNELERARAIFELAVNQPLLDMPEVLWKAYIDFEIDLGEHDRTRTLYGRLLERTKHVKVWISYAQFEASIPNNMAQARLVFQEADRMLRGREEKREERVMLLEAWRDVEKTKGTTATLKAVTEKMPRRIKKKRPVKNEDGSEGGWEEYYDYIFPDEENKQSNLKLLQAAQKWKKQKLLGVD